jgi:predicted Zn-dependent protease
MAQQKLVTIGTQVVAGSLENVSDGQRLMLYRALGLGAQYGYVLPFSRKHESEADHIGLLLMAAAGYDPSEASAFWGRMSRASSGSGKPSEFFSTHPSDQRRAADLRRWLNQALPLYEHSQRQRSNAPLPR